MRRINLTRANAKLAIVAAASLLGLALAGCNRATPPTDPPSTATNAVVAPTTAVAPAGTDAAQLIRQLAAINVTNGPVSATQAAEWKSNLTNLIAHGPAAVPAIEAFLLKNVDLGFEPHGNAQLLAAGSLRLALIQALGRIGAPEAVALATRILSATADPQELAAVARFLEHAEPGRHHAAFATAARETLAIAASGQWDGRDVAPLFALLQVFGRTNDLAELPRYGNTWFAYVPITLAHWPNGAGIPTLIQLVQNADGRITLGRDIYYRMLAEAAVRSPAAADALEAQVRRNVIEVGTWPGIGRALAGDALRLPEFFPAAGNAPAVAAPRTYHLSVGNQNYREATLPENTPPKEIGARINLVDRLLEATTNPAALDALEAARVSLSARLPRQR